MELERYGIRWRGKNDPTYEQMPDGYWTPWHIAQEENDRLRAEVETARRDAVTLDHAYAGAMVEAEALDGECERLRAEVEALREALRYVLINAYSPDDVIYAAETALAAGRRE
jgi:hypothetical protein